MRKPFTHEFPPRDHECDDFYKFRDSDNRPSLFIAKILRRTKRNGTCLILTSPFITDSYTVKVKKYIRQNKDMPLCDNIEFSECLTPEN